MSSTAQPEEDRSAAGLMDRIYRHQRHVYDFTRKYYLLGRDEMLAALDPPVGGSVLEIGCGTARNLVLAARRFPDADYFGIDISREMLATGARNVVRAGLAGRVRLAEGDATAPDPCRLFGRERFDRVFISYSLSMIPGWRSALRGALGVVGPAGRLSVLDFGQQEGLPDWFGTALRAWLSRFHVEPRQELARAIAAEAMEQGCSWRVGPLHRGYAWYGEIRRPEISG